MANVVEVTLRGRDETKALVKAIGALKGALAGIGILGALRAIGTNVAQAQKTVANLDSAFKSVEKTIGLTREQMDDLASSVQKTTTVSSGLVKEAEAILLTFDRVNNEAFGRTIKVATDMSARLGVDLVGATKSLGLALSDPEKAFDRLRRSGVVLDSNLKDVVKQLAETGELSKAQSLILTELETKFRGSAAAARNTLGGALIGLKNSFGDLFEGTRTSTTGLVDAINDLSDVLNDPIVKQGTDLLIAGLSGIASAATRAATEVLRVPVSIKDMLKNIRDALPSLRMFFSNPMAGLASSAFGLNRGATQGLRDEAATQGKGSAPFSIPKVIDVESVNLIKAARIELGAYSELLESLNQSTKTSTESQIAAYYELKEALKLLRQEGVITQQQFAERIGESIDETLMIDLEPIRGMYKDIRTQTSELGEFMKGVWRSAGESIRQTLSDAVYSGKLSLRSLVDIGRRVVADIISAFAVEGIKNLFTGSKGGTGFFGSLAAAFGFSAGGGKSTRPRWVGEEGRELVVPGSGGMSVYNKRQLAGMGGGGATYAPINNWQLIERDDPDKTKREILQTVAIQNSKQMAEFQRALARAGVEVRF